MKLNMIVAFVLCAFVLWPAESFAYIDPGTGSILIQGIIGAIAAIGVTLKLYWHRIVAYFRRESTEDSPPGESRKIEEPSQQDDT
jgi:hypothetical protein